uniref:KAP family P-loop domain protein n=1 Tax=Eubacterium cellulosolvens (strain ATCC 43171 / JCM 9499 / 6) TaxID=633697 RepID=I5AWU4_EUBC6
MWKDSETTTDYLDYDYLVSSVERIITNDGLLPASIGIYGDWGSGKSSLMKMCQERLTQNDDSIKCIYFNGWLFESYEDAKTALLSSIIDEIREDERFKDKVKDVIDGISESIDIFKLAQFALKTGLDIAASGGLATVLGLSIGTIAKNVANQASTVDTEKLSGVIDNVKDKLDKKELRESIRKFQESFADLIKRSKMSRLVIFIDELDRCRPDTILDTLEAMKLFMFTGKVAFVIGADESHITYAVKSKFADIEGIQINIGQEYLEKLIQYPIRIPRMNICETETYIASLLLEDIFTKDELKGIFESARQNDEDFYFASCIPLLQKNEEVTKNKDAKVAVSIAEQVSGILSAGLHGNPRQVKRFLNTMDMRIEQAKCKKAELNKSILVKLMLLEYIKPSIFSKFAELNYENKLQDELSILESDDATRSEEFADRLKDDWFVKWLNISPKLFEESLGKYFYFARTSLDEKISRISSVLSPAAQNILDAIMNESELALNTAMKNDISIVEKANIIEGFAIQARALNKISNKKIEYFIRFIDSYDDLYQEALDVIGTFTYKQIELGSIIHFADMSSKAGLVDEMRTIINRWDKDRGEDKFIKPFEKRIKGK